MSLVKPNSTIFSNGFTATGAATLHAATSDRLDSSYISQGGTATKTLQFGLDGTVDHLVDPRPLYMNFRMRYNGALADNANLQLKMFADDQHNAVMSPAFTLASSGVQVLTTSFLWYNLQVTQNWQAGGGDPTNAIQIVFAPGGSNTGTLEIAEVNFSTTAEANSVDYPQAGAASVTMSGAESNTRNLNVSAGASVTMTGTKEALLTLADTATSSGTDKNGNTVTDTADVTFEPATAYPFDTVSVTVVPITGMTISDIIVDGVSIAATYSSQWTGGASFVFDYEVPTTGPDIEIVTIANVPTPNRSSLLLSMALEDMHIGGGGSYEDRVKAQNERKRRREQGLH